MVNVIKKLQIVRFKLYFLENEFCPLIALNSVWDIFMSFYGKYSAGYTKLTNKQLWWKIWFSLWMTAKFVFSSNSKLKDYAVQHFLAVQLRQF